MKFEYFFNIKAGKYYETALCLYKIQKSDALAHNPNKLENRKKYLK